MQYFSLNGSYYYIEFWISDLMKILPLYSSSSGNCFFVGTDKTGILIDTGVSFSYIKRALAMYNVALNTIQAIFITHTHSDHISGLKTTSKVLNIPVYAHLDCFPALSPLCSEKLLRDINGGVSISGEFFVKSFNTSHDCPGSVGYTLEHKNRKFMFCTDLGEITAEVRNAAINVNSAVVESNYDDSSLINNPYYPRYLKERIQSSAGHLENKSSAEFLAELVKNGATRIFAAHLSQKNNTPDIVLNTLRTVMKNNNITAGVDYIFDIAPVFPDGRTWVV